MSTLNAIILGLVQGLAEFLPISSSGHLVLAQNLFGLSGGEEYVVFDILLHVGTLVSVFVFYWRDVVELIKTFFGIIGDLFKGRLDIKTGKRNFLAMLVVATLPLGLALIFKSKVEAAFSRPWFVGVALLFTGVILYITDKIRIGELNEDTGKYRSALSVGIFQLIAVFPGVSRSGLTIFGGLIAGFKKETAVKLSLLLSVIAVLGAAAASVPDVIHGEGLSVGVIPCLHNAFDSFFTPA